MKASTTTTSTTGPATTTTTTTTSSSPSTATAPTEVVVALRRTTTTVPLLVEKKTTKKRAEKLRRRTAKSQRMERKRTWPMSSTAYSERSRHRRMANNPSRKATIPRKQMVDSNNRRKEETELHRTKGGKERKKMKTTWFVSLREFRNKLLHYISKRNISNNFQKMKKII